MRNLKRSAVLCAVLAVSACTTPNPEAPNLQGAIVEPLNPTQWDHEAAVIRRQEILGGL